MLTVMLPGEDRVTTAHRAKLAFIYVRQSSIGQVRQHQESTELQYRLVDHALRLGLAAGTGQAEREEKKGVTII
jgi:hypothetical protein